MCDTNNNVGGSMVMNRYGLLDKDIKQLSEHVVKKREKARMYMRKIKYDMDHRLMANYYYPLTTGMFNLFVIISELDKLMNELKQKGVDIIRLSTTAYYGAVMGRKLRKVLYEHEKKGVFYNIPARLLYELYPSATKYDFLKRMTDAGFIESLDISKSDVKISTNHKLYYRITDYGREVFECAVKMYALFHKSKAHEYFDTMFVRAFNEGMNIQDKS